MWGAGPRKGTEAYRVEQEVEKRKRIAEDKHVKELITEVYFSNIKYFPSWKKNSSEYVPSSISKASEKTITTETGDDKTITEITLNGNQYKFAFHDEGIPTYMDSNDCCGTLELYDSERKILAINVAETLDSEYSDWRPISIDAFIDGEWIEEFRQLQKDIETIRVEMQIRMAEDPEKTAQLKKDFGIE